VLLSCLLADDRRGSTCDGTGGSLEASGALLRVLGVRIVLASGVSYHIPEELVSDAVHSPVELVFFDVSLFVNNLSKKESEEFRRTRSIAYRFDDLQAFQSWLSRPCELGVTPGLRMMRLRRVILLLSPLSVMFGEYTVVGADRLLKRLVRNPLSRGVMDSNSWKVLRNSSE